MRSTSLACALLVLTGCQETVASCPAGQVRNELGVCVDEPGVDGGTDAGPADGGPDCGGPCGVDTPICADTMDGPMCVECLTSADCGGETCNPETFRCPECTDDAMCMDPGLGRCDVGFCSPCTDDAQCVHFSPGAATTCDEDTGVCVECTPDTEAVDCDANACDPVDLTCTGTMRNSLETCEACLADSECAVGSRCIELDFPTGTNRDFYCLPERPSGGCGTIPAPYRVGLADRVSRSDAAAATYCGINEMLTTCEAVRAALDGVGVTPPCTPGSAACPEGGLCATVGAGGTNRCTYPCNGVTQCPADPDLADCPTVTDSYCGRQ